MRSLRKLNAAAGTSYTRWEQVVQALHCARCTPCNACKLHGCGSPAEAGVDWSCQCP